MVGTPLVWDETADRPALVPLARGGDQRHYLFVAAPDQDGEDAVVALDDRPSMFVKYASVGHLLANAASKDGAATRGDPEVGYARALARAKRRWHHTWRASATRWTKNVRPTARRNRA